MRLLASDTTTALGVDIQEKFVSHISQYEQMLDRSEILILILNLSIEIKIRS